MCDNTKCVFALYMLLNKINGKKYIGLTKNAEKRFKGNAGTWRNVSGRTSV